MIFKVSLQKPVFVIGAQISIEEPGSEGKLQIANTLRVALAFHRREIIGVYNVCIGDVWDGSRLMKRRELNYMAFHTPGRYPVAQAWPKVTLKSGYREKDPGLAVQGLRLDTEFAQNVVMLNTSADSPPWLLMDQVKGRRLEGVILECKGIGNIPDRKWQDGEQKYSWIDVIKAATDTGIYVGILSPFEDGRVILDRYEPGQRAKEAGALSLESLTPAMADFKFRQAIAKYPNSREKVQAFIQTDIIGELLPAIEDTETH